MHRQCISDKGSVSRIHEELKKKKKMGPQKT